MDFLDLKQFVYHEKTEAEKYSNNSVKTDRTKGWVSGYIKACEDFLEKIKEVEARGTQEQRIDNLLGEVKRLNDRVTELEERF